MRNCISAIIQVYFDVRAEEKCRDAEAKEK